MEETDYISGGLLLNREFVTILCQVSSQGIYNTGRWAERGVGSQSVGTVLTRYLSSPRSLQTH